MGAELAVMANMYDMGIMFNSVQLDCGKANMWSMKSAFNLGLRKTYARGSIDKVRSLL